MKSLRPIGRVLSLAFFSGAVCLSVLAWTATESAAVSARDVWKCQKSVNKAAEKHAKLSLVSYSGCVDKLIACELSEELDGKDGTACRSKAVQSCNAKLARLSTARSKLSGIFTRKCSTLRDWELSSRRGMGFIDAGTACAGLPTPRSANDAAELALCLPDLVACRVDQALEQSAPRARQLLDDAGVVAQNPDLFTCLESRPSSTAGGGDAKDLAKCQKALQKNNRKALGSAHKSSFGCANALLNCQLEEDRLEASAADTTACQAKVASKCTKLLAKTTAADSKRQAGNSASCGAISAANLLTGLGFEQIPGVSGCAAPYDTVSCPAFSPPDNAWFEIVGAVQPRTCTLLSDAGMVGIYDDPTCIPSCGNAVVDSDEACDDGNADNVDSCANDCSSGPTSFEHFEIASSASTAHTPDGTAGTAVPPASTLDVQFGTTIIDLNKAVYDRCHLNGAGDPEAVMITAPGFAGGANSFRYLAENLVVQAAARGLVLEVWNSERRTNLLEDRAGGLLAAQQNDPELILDWYFGAQLGLSLDPRLSRRAVFHQGADVAFISEQTPNVHARDIDAIVQQAASLPSAPAVFLAGHSLGTTFASRYAATDFDTGPGVTPGHASLSGLIFFEGGGDSIPSGPLSDDDLDTIIAKADGGLYSAIINDDARCWDGTACPGGDSDCSALALPPGALSNKCVEPVEVFTGDNLDAAVVFITPGVHAASDVISNQGILDPEGQALIQKDYGTGSAVDLVDSLGILDILPPSSVEAGLGFFLDDDFSPVTAFMSSMGYSSNGGNLPFVGGLIIPYPAFVGDPYRLWIDIDEPMPSVAVPDNGVAFSANQVNGQEVEISRVDVLLSTLSAGESNFGDWYFPSSGLSVTAASQSTFSGGLDSTQLSVDRGRPDIENLTEAANIGLPVICLGGTNGLTPTNGSFRNFAHSIGPCTAASCDGTARVLTNLAVNTVYGDVAGGFEVHLSEGYAHIDVLSAEPDDPGNQVYTPLLDFLERNTPAP